MALFWQVVTLLSVWLLYGFAASLFVKGSNKRDYLLLISSGLLGGLIGGRIGNILDVPDNIWWLREVCLLYTSPSPRDKRQSRMPSSA